MGQGNKKRKPGRYANGALISSAKADMQTEQQKNIRRKADNLRNALKAEKPQRQLTTKQKMRQSISESSTKLREQKRVEREKAAAEKKANKKYVSPYERKHGKPQPGVSTTTSKSKGKGGGVTINGKPPTAIQKKLLKGGWSAKELEAKINARKKKK